MGPSKPRPSWRHCRIAGIVLVLAGLLILPGCWTFSMEPLFDGPTDPALTTDQTLVGAWGYVNDGCQWTLTIAISGRNYNLTMAPGAGCQSDEKTTRYQAYLVKLDEHRFLDLEPNEKEVCDLCLSAHTFALLTLENNNLVLTPLDGDWLLHAINDKKLALAHVGGDGEYIDMTLTARPAELQAFLREHADDKEAFKVKDRLVFTRK
jgi:hypothetical protein